MTLHIGGVAAVIVLLAAGLGTLVYRWTASAGSSRGERLALALASAAAAASLLGTAFGVNAAHGQAPPPPPATAPCRPPTSPTPPATHPGYGCRTAG